jgi:hypothetical protein
LIKKKEKEIETIAIERERERGKKSFFYTSIKRGYTISRPCTDLFSREVGHAYCLNSSEGAVRVVGDDVVCVNDEDMLSLDNCLCCMSWIVCNFNKDVYRSKQKNKGEKDRERINNTRNMIFKLLPCCMQ